MTEWQVAGIMAYILIGLFLADVISVRIDRFYWIVLFLWPLILAAGIVAFIFLFIISLIIRIKNYEAEEML